MRALLGQEVREIGTLEAARGGQAEGRPAQRLGHADPRGLGVQLRRGRQDVGPPLEQLRRQAGRDLERHLLLRQLAAARDRLRVAAEQERQRVLGLRDRPLEAGHGGGRVGLLDLGLAQVELGDDPALEALRDQARRVLPAGQRALADRRAGVEVAQELEVLARDLGDQRDRDRRGGSPLPPAGRPRRLGEAPQLAPQVDLPGDAEAQARSRSSARPRPVRTGCWGSPARRPW